MTAAGEEAVKEATCKETAAKNCPDLSKATHPGTWKMT